MDGHIGIKWIQTKTTGSHIIIDSQPPNEEDLMANNSSADEDNYLVAATDADDEDVEEAVVLPSDTDQLAQIAAENLIFMARDGQMVGEIITTGADGDETETMIVTTNGNTLDCEAVLQQVVALSNHQTHHQHIVDQQELMQQVVLEASEDHCYTTNADGMEYVETTPQMVTEEVITDDWVQHQGEERVEIPAEQVIGSASQVLLDMEVPLPTVQDEYTALRPYPCDFCSRRFRKKATLMNHMVAHQTDRPHLCKLCGDRFFRRSDLIAHLKAHAETPDFEEDEAMQYGSSASQTPTHHQQQQQNLIYSSNTPTQDHYYNDHEEWSQQQEQKQSEVSSKSKKSRTSASTTSTAASSANSSTARGRISRLKPKEENYTINESLSYGIVEEQLQASTAAVKLTQDSPALQKHYPIIDDSKPFVCQQCGLAFAREKALMSHTKNHRNDSPFECNECNEIFWDANTLQEHQKSHQFEESNSEYDPAEADDSQSESESEPQYGDFYCSECGVSFHRQDLLKRHTKTHHRRKDAVQVTGGVSFEHNSDRHCCNTCGETFAEALDLLAHAEIHARYPPFKCVLCGESFFEEPTIKRHLQTQHASEMTENSCILCGKHCRDRKALIKHAWDHSREKCHSCSSCGKNFHNKARLKRHMASHRDKSVICDVCNEEFPDGRSLSNHRHSHSATNSGKLFPCNECGKTFGSRSSQQIHVRIHTGERPYGCRFCWKAFADGGTLRKHERIHTGEKPYACSVCPRAFNQRVVLREHIRSHHSGLDTKRGTYHCTVCSADLTTSGDLIQHLIQHSDRNTAMQRQPVSGPRKYKRRRKLKPHEIARLRSEGKHIEGNGSDLDLSDFDMDNVDDLLGITNDENEKSIKVEENIKNNKPNRKSTRNARSSSKHQAAGSNQNYEEDEMAEDDCDGDGGDDEDVDIEGSGTMEKLMQNINKEDSYKSLISNVENTLQSLDTLVVPQTTATTKNAHEGGAQRTQQVQILKMETKYAETTSQSGKRKRAAAEMAASKNLIKPSRPRMIHTEKTKVSGNEGSSKKRSKTLITRIETQSSGLTRANNRSSNTQQESISNLDLLAQHSTPRSNSIVDDFEIICPATQPPKQISCSPLYVKQEQQESTRLLSTTQSQLSSSQNSSRNSDLYDAQLLLETSNLRKEVYEKFNPSIVQDLEEILRSPIKSDKNGNERQRFTSESSTNQFLNEQSDAEEQHFIKIEPTSPDLREIVSSSSNSSAAKALSSNNTPRPTRNNRTSRIVTPNRKYLQFETTEQKSNNNNSSRTSPSKRTQNCINSNSYNKASKKSTSKTNNHQSMNTTSNSSPSSSSYLNYSFVINTPSHHNSTTHSSNFTHLNSNTEDLNKATTTAANTNTVERKRRYFECEMCSAVFPDRAQLLDHVPIHI